MNLKSAVTVSGVFALKTCLHEPLAFAFLTLKTNAPATGCESAEITRQVTVYVPWGSLRSILTATELLLGRRIFPESTRPPPQS